jgi:hypothetical protein
MCLNCTMTLTVLPLADPCLAFARKPDSSEPMFETLPFWRAEGEVEPKAMPVARNTTRLTRFPHAALWRSLRRGFCCFHVRNIDLPCRSGGKSPARNHLFRCTAAANWTRVSHCKHWICTLAARLGWATLSQAGAHGTICRRRNRVLEGGV